MASEVVLLSLHISLYPCIERLVSLAAEVQFLLPCYYFPPINALTVLRDCRSYSGYDAG